MLHRMIGWTTELCWFDLVPSSDKATSLSWYIYSKKVWIVYRKGRFWSHNLIWFWCKDKYFLALCAASKRIIQKSVSYHCDPYYGRRSFGWQGARTPGHLALHRFWTRLLKRTKVQVFYQQQFSWHVLSAVSYFYCCSELVGTDVWKKYSYI